MSRDPAPREIAHAIFMAGVDRVRPERVMADLAKNGAFVADLAAARRIIVVGGGKAGAGMTLALVNCFPEFVAKMTGVVNVPDDQVRSTRAVRLHASRPMGLNEPTPLAATSAAEMLALARSATADDLVVVLLSGGASALLPMPVEGVSLDDKIAVTRLMSAAGADIRQLNCVRKHLSQIKGGRLAEAAKAARAVWGLIISDVVGDPLDVIASGPTTADPTTFLDVMDHLRELGLHGLLPKSVRHFLRHACMGERPETPKSLPPHVRNVLLATNADALNAATAFAERRGFAVWNLGSNVTGDTTALALQVAANVRDWQTRPGRHCLLIGGETTVNLGPNPGRGGRNQEFVLALTCELADLSRVTILSGGTDGEDGPTDAAGAIIDEEFWAIVAAKGLDPVDFLHRHDAYPFFESIGGLLKTGLTGTNVMDLRVILVESL